jgi:hypothetical protein
VPAQFLPRVVALELETLWTRINLVSLLVFYPCPCSSDRERLASEIRAQGFCSRSNRSKVRAMLLPDHRLAIPGPLHWDPIYSGASATRAGFEVVHTYRKMLDFSAFYILCAATTREIRSQSHNPHYDNPAEVKNRRSF